MKRTAGLHLRPASPVAPARAEDAYPAVIEVALAIDVGGTKVAAAIVTADGNVLARAAAGTPEGDEGDEVTDQILALADEVRAGGQGRGTGADHEVVVCGVGCGGPMSLGGEEVSPLNIGSMRGYPLRSRLARATGVTTFVDNDAKALALGEGWCGAAAGCDNFVAMVVSTGVGGGIVLDGRLLDGDGGNAGHIGHVIVVPDGRSCRCGARGCLEAEASGTAIAAITGRPAAEADEEVIDRTAALVGRAVASVANLLDLRLAVVAGSVALGFGDRFFSRAQDEVDRLARLEFSVGTRIVAAGLGDLGPLVGAAAVGWRGLQRLVPPR
ncbi:MAG: ROK family protein [Acidimicrobiales bacterium]